MTTPYSRENAELTNAAHEAAKRDVYPEVFPDAVITYERMALHANERSRIYDGELGIDVILHVDQGFRKPLPFTVQERFRRPKYRERQDATITEWNNATGEPSELFKLACDFVVYGYFDPVADTIIEALVVYGAALKDALIDGAMPYGEQGNPRSHQTFITLKFRDLHERGLVRHHRVADAPVALVRGIPAWSDEDVPPWCRP